MTSTHERSDEGNHLDVMEIEEQDGHNIYVFYPKDATEEDIETMWIRASENEISWLTDHR